MKGQRRLCIYSTELIIPFDFLLLIVTTLPILTGSCRNSHLLDATGSEYQMSTAKMTPTASVLSSTIKNLGFGLRLPSYTVLPNNFKPHYGCSQRRLCIMAKSSASNPLEVCAKASVTIPNKLGDCELCPPPLLPLIVAQTLFDYGESEPK